MPDSKSAVKLQARVDSQGVFLQARGLPAAWQGKALHVFPHTARVFATASSPTQSDAVRTGGEPEPGTAKKPEKKADVVDADFEVVDDDKKKK